MRNFNWAVALGLLLVGGLLGCGASPAPVVTPAAPPSPPPPVAPVAPVAAPVPAPLPPALVAKVESLPALYKQMSDHAAKMAAEPDNVEANLLASQQLTGKIQSLLLEINAAQAELTPEQRTEFATKYASKLVPPTPVVPATPATPPANP